MATMQEAIRRLRHVFTVEGVEQTVAGYKKVEGAQAGIASSSTTAERATLSLEKSFNNMERRYNSVVRAQQDYQKVQDRVNAAVAQNPALQARANEVLRLAGEHYGRASAAQTVWSRGLQAANDNAQAFAARLGPIGGMLASLGPAGLVAAGGIGAAAVATALLVREADALAQRAGKMVDFAETTGLTTSQLQALQRAGAQVGIENDKIGQGFERFTTQMEQLRRGTGELNEAIIRIDPALADQLARARNAGEAWDIFARAIQKADRELANVASRAAFGRQGFGFTRLAASTVDAGGIVGLEAQARRNELAEAQLRRLDQLGDDINQTFSEARNNFAAMFSEEILQAQLTFSQRLLSISQIAREFKMSDDYRRLMAAMSLIMTGGRGSSRSTAAAPFVPTSGFAASIPQNEGRSGSSGIGAGLLSTVGNFFPAGFTSAANGVPISDDRRLETLQKTIAAMGSAATAAQQLEARYLALKIARDGNVLTEGQYQRALAVTAIDDTIAKEQRRLGLLGDLATSLEVVAAVQRKIDREAMDGINISEADAERLRERARRAHENAQLPNQLMFERDQMFRSPTDQRVQETLRSRNLTMGDPDGRAAAECVDFNRSLRVPERSNDNERDSRRDAA